MDNQVLFPHPTSQKDIWHMCLTSPHLWGCGFSRDRVVLPRCCCLSTVFPELSTVLDINVAVGKYISPHIWVDIEICFFGCNFWDILASNTVIMLIKIKIFRR
jgi:hypothetical protein